MGPELLASYKTAEAIARSRSNFYYSFVVLPSEKRRAFCAVYAFMRYCDDISDGDAGVDAKRAMLKDWRAQLDAAARAKADAEAKAEADAAAKARAEADAKAKAAAEAQRLADEKAKIEADLDKIRQQRAQERESRAAAAPSAAPVKIEKKAAAPKDAEKRAVVPEKSVSEKIVETLVWVHRRNR